MSGIILPKNLTGDTLDQLIDRCAETMRFLPTLYYRERCNRLAELMCVTPYGHGFLEKDRIEVTRLLTDRTWNPNQIPHAH